MTAIALQPRSAIEIVDAGFRLLRRFYPQLAALSVAALLPYIVLVLLVGGAPRNPALGLPLLLVQFLCTTLAEAATIVAVSDGYLEGEAPVASALGRTATRLGTLAAAALLRGLAVGVTAGITVALSMVVFGLVLPRPFGLVFGAVLGFIPAFYVIVRTFAVAPAVMLERRGALESLARSWELARGQVGRCFVALLLAWLIYIVLIAVVSLLVGLLQPRNPTLSGVLSAAFLALIFPLIGVVTTLLYYDLRVRREGFDLEMMAKELAASGSQ